MKIMFLLQLDFAKLGHAIAVKLKEKYGLNNFCAFVQGCHSYKFIKNQKEVVYDPILYDGDVHNGYHKEIVDMKFINELEEKYGLPNLWKYVYVDRTVAMRKIGFTYKYGFSYNYNDVLKLLQRRFRIIESFIEKANPDILIGTCFAGMSTLILYHIAKKMNIPIITIFTTRIKNRITFSDNTYDEFGYIYKVYDDIISGKRNANYIQEAQEFIEEFRNKRIYYEGVQPLDLDKPLLEKSFIKTLYGIIKHFYNYYFGDYKKDYLFTNTINVVYDKIRVYLRKKSLKNWKRWEFIDDKEEFVFFPLHVEPEMALMLWAPYYTNQINLIQNIAQSLPIRMKLYVKEHPAMFGMREKSYYKKLLRIPNVKLIHPSVDSYELIKKSKIVFTISGTAGWEALLLGKPVITFGNVFYNKLDFVKKVKDITELSWIIKETLENYKFDEKKLLYFAASIFEESFPINFYSLWYEKDYNKILSSEDLEILVSKLAQKMELVK